ncbi:MAG: CxxC-x17-CxxC domain-containing protein [Patescibacteria group bacterium]
METPELPYNRDLTYIGLASFRNKNQIFGIKRKDRRQHVYVLGKSGTGKSVLLSNMIIQNINNGEGVCVVDPHGELVEGILGSIPPNRIKDVVYFNPADTDFHLGLNVLELIDPQYKHLVASGLMGIFTKIWANVWSARMEYILNNAILALLETPGSTLLGVTRMLVDKPYRKTIVDNLKDPIIKGFWVNEYETWQDKFRNEAITPIQNKVGQFLSSSIVRNVVGQAKSTINLFNIMNEGKIFLVNVSKGRIGEDNSALLGGMIITKLQLAAMERVRIPEDERKDFYLYVDEFQNFVTDSFASILSEARKYRLNLTVAHQYTAQLVTGNGSAVRDAVFGNVGTMIIFRVGADDADFLEKEFEPEFMAQDIVNLPNYRIYLKLMIDGVTSRPFSARTLPPIVAKTDKGIEEEVIVSSRALYARSKEVVEAEINDWSGMSLGSITATTPMKIEKPMFEVKCSHCGKDTSVPFQPEPGRPVYCKDCLAKMKTGEIVIPRPQPVPVPQVKSIPSVPFIKKIFTKQPEQTKTTFVPRPVNPPQAKPEQNFALKDLLNKAISEKEKEVAIPVQQKIPDAPAPISLNSLKKEPTPITNNAFGKDKSASSEDINKFKNFVSSINPTQSEIQKEEIKPQPIKEVPEDVLRKILE